MRSCVASSTAAAGRPGRVAAAARRVTRVLERCPLRRGQRVGRALGGIRRQVVVLPWADVDTRNSTVSPAGSNLVHYDLDATNGIFTVTWDLVGRYTLDNQLLNAFQVRLTRRDDINGIEVEFRYGQLQWLRGSVSTSGLYRLNR